METCPKCNRAITQEPGRALEETCPGCGQRLSSTEAAPPPGPDGGDPLPELPPRYRVVACLGIGSLAVVYHARDEELRRDVAVKVIHARLLRSARAVELFLAEAHILAGLDHPGIMPIYDLGQTLDGRYFAVIKRFEGSDLQNRLRQGRPSVAESVEIVAQAAEALHHAHQHGLVHRDVKPGNLLLDGNGKIIVADFDLALRNEDFGTGPAFVGTVPYMSPEQARRESHRVNARTDIYSLGVVLYECLAGRRPFVNPSKDELLELIKTQEPTPLRQLDPAVSPELERICLKAMAKRVTDRFGTAREMAEDLRLWQCQQARPATSSKENAADLGPPDQAGPSPIVPRGLRSFRVEDSDFFLELLPGPRNRAGLPESVAFWKAYLENTDPEHADGLGLLYGPSGCGKSSLVKAGLLPRLGPNIVAIYQEATPQQTEQRLLQALRRTFLELPPNLGLAASLESLRRGTGLPPGKKAVLVLDQFEQWLHASPEDQRAEMVAALRQCDGVHLQCLLLVRDDFWLSVSRFMREVEVRLVEGQNSGMVDLFDPLHSRKVLAAFGRAYGRLPANAALGSEEEEFLDEAIAGLTEDGKVMPVRLALFAEIVKGKPWTQQTLQDVGGPEGIGVAFLEEALSASTAPAANRHHEQAARAVLRALLPDAETSLKGRLHPLEELRAASGYAQDAESFAELLRILDQGLRLVTPATEGGRGDSGPVDRPGQSQRYYQLTHDYLVPALRQWLSNKQRETRRGRAELRLADCAVFWNSRPERRRLPRWWEWVNILVFTRSRFWTDAQRRMMRSANRYYTITTAATLLLLATVVLGGDAFRRQLDEEHNNTKADQIVGDMCSFHQHQLAHFQAEARRLAPWTVPRLRALIANPQSEPDDRLHARLVLLPMDEGQASYLEEALLIADPRELMEIRAGLLPYRDRLHEGLWKKAQDAGQPVERRCRAAAALALFAPEDSRWSAIGPMVVGHLVADSPLVLARWIEAFRPVRFRLLTALNDAFRDQHDVHRRVTAVHILQDYAGDQPDVLAELVLDAGDLQYALLWPTIHANAGAITDRLTRFLGQPAPGDETPVARDTRTRRKAQAAATLLYLGRGDALGAVLKDLNDPALRSYLIHFYHPGGADSQSLYRSWERERDRSIHLALLFELGEFDLSSLAHAMKVPLIDQLMALYRNDPDPGCHSTLDWLLRYRWGLGDQLRAIDQDLPGPRPADRRWFVNSQGQHFAVLAGPLEYFRGPPESSQPAEALLRQQVPRSFAISTRRVTVAQLQRFRKDHPGAPTPAANDQAEPTAPAVGMSWYEAARYCRWLSEQEGVAEDQMCYPPIDQIKEGMKLPADYLTRTGYRLPTESEWEFACLSGPRFPRSANDQLLGHYAWHFGSYSKRVTAEDRVKPNGFGVFEVQGAVGSWCQEVWKPLPKATTTQPVVDREDLLPVSGTTDRVVRGCFGALPAGLSGSEYRSGLKPAERSEHVGLRVVRTIRD